VDLGHFFSSLIHTRSVGLLGQVISKSRGRYLQTGQYKQNKRTQKSMPWVGFEPTIAALERAKTVHALDSAVTVIGFPHVYIYIFCDVGLQQHTAVPDKFSAGDSQGKFVVEEDRNGEL
jgi:ATP-dependent RNA circularization protein (DNA/RNA ligase family)